ncbi:hypothetical protein GUJ93_ZPchr0009g848 [Zizania palustris]|uniref:Uncharacterized protein n=1 Tax=Zizania palustris TaxID=103762 RepID=A0A8J5RLU4_ZIZPA|nr:hypothetical protein GUJ93_ZPchr0009g848 [Zizania palustris]
MCRATRAHPCVAARRAAHARPHVTTRHPSPTWLCPRAARCPHGGAASRRPPPAHAVPPTPLEPSSALLPARAPSPAWPSPPAQRWPHATYADRTLPRAPPCGLNAQRVREGIIPGIDNG